MKTALRTVGLCIALAACGSRAVSPEPEPKRDQPRVLAFEPGDELERTDAALTLRFDRPMVSAEAVGPMLDAAPVALSPELPLRAHWSDRSTLVLEPEREFQSGMRYVLSVAGAEYRFDVQPLRIAYTSLPETNVPRRPEFEVSFSLPVDASQVAGRCGLRPGGGAPVAVEATPTDEPSRVLLRAKAELALHTRYAIECPELTAAGGTAPWRPQREPTGFTTHGLLALDAQFPPANSALPPEHSGVCLGFSTPVSLPQLAKHVRVEPAPPGLAQAWYEGPCSSERQEATDRANSLLLAPQTAYRVSVDAALTDDFGQQLGQPRQWEFRTGDRVPGLWTATGFGGVLERGRREHALGAMNLASAELRCLPLTPAQLAMTWRGLSDWVGETFYEWEGERPPPPAAAWELLGTRPRKHVLDAAAAANAPRQLALDLAAQCGAGGLYALDLTPVPVAKGAELQGDRPARWLGNVTDLGVVAKRGASSALAWVSRLSNGEPVSGASVELLDGGGRTLASATSDARGLAVLPALPSPRETELFAVRASDDVAVVGGSYPWDEGLRSWQLGVRGASEAGVRLFVHTDRGVYRPGERVYVHGLARLLRDKAPARVPAQRAISVALHDAARVIEARELSLSDFGSFATHFDLPAHLAPGSLTLRVQSGQQSEYYPISVAEFRPLSFELTGGPRRSELLAGEPVQLDVAARYLFGTPLAAADLEWTVERAPGSVEAPDLAGFNFEDSSPALPDEEPWPSPPSGIVFQRAGKTDAEGRAQLEFAAEAARRPTRYLVTLAASDAAKDRATRSFSVLAHSAERYVGTRLPSFLVGRGEPLRAEFVLIDRTGKRVAGEADVELRQEQWQCRDPRAECRATVRVLEQRHVTIEAGAPAAVSFETKEAEGRLHVRASTRDAAGRQARSSDYGFVWSQAGSGPYEDRIAAPLSLDRRAYQVGDRAYAALQTPLALSRLLITAERGELLAADVVPASAGLASLTFDASAAPNVFVTLTGMTPRTAAGEAGRPRLVSGAAEVRVEGPSRALLAKIALARERVQPHERVEGDVLVTHLGKPLPAEVALVAVNESVLQLTGFATPDPVPVFHAPRGLSVTTLSNIPQVIGDPASNAQVPLTREVGTPGEDGGGGKPALRQDYVAAAYVAPQLRTDKQGRAHFAFDAPEDLSAYRLMAIVAARDDRVGSSEARLTVAQPLAAKLVAPRFVSRGDSLELGALVHDTTGQPGPTELRFTAQGLWLEQSSQQLTATPAGALARSRARVEDVDRAYFEVEAHKGQAADRVRHELSVRRPLDTELRVLSQGRTARARVALQWPAGIDRAQSRLEIAADRAGLAGLLPLLRMLLDYPYGCTEQTAAALSAIAAAPELTRAIAPELAEPERLNARVADGIAALLQARAADGRFGLYPGLAGRLWLTALVLETGLGLRAAGFAVPDALLGEAAQPLSAALAEQNPARLARGDLEHAAHTLWLLAQLGAAPAGVLQRVWAERGRMSPEGLAYTLLAAAASGSDETLRAPVRAALERGDWLDRPRDPDAPLASPERTTALALRALATEPQPSAASERLARWLVARAEDPAVYLSTRDVAETLAALRSWAQRAEAGANQLRIGLGDRVLWQGALRGAQVVSLQRNAGEAAAGEVWVEADGELTVSIRRREVTASAPKPAFARGLTLLRRYLEPKSGRPLAEVNRGDLVLVELELQSERALRMLAVTDPLPAGFEALDPSLSSGRVAGCARCDEASGFDYVRRHDDRIEAFAEWQAAGKHRLRYLLRATTAGSFTAPGATAGLMYLPDFFARSAVGAVRVR